MPNPFRALIRASAFWRKEIFEMLRQPRMILALVLGPFLILFLFGIGYQNRAPVFRTLFVIPQGSALSQHLQEYTSGMQAQFIYEGETDNMQQALDRLQRGEVDLVIAAPQDAYDTVRSNHQAVFTIYNNELDPIQANWVKYYGYVFANEVNRRVLQSMAEQGKTDVSKLQSNLQAARANIATMRSALQKGDTAAAHDQQTQLNTNLDLLELAAGTTLGVLAGVDQTVGSPNDPRGTDASNALADLRQNAGQLGTSSGDTNSQLQRLTQMDQDLAKLQSDVGQFESIDSAVLVNPFTNETKSTLPIEITATDFFAPAVLALLLQHLAVTFAALSIVRERTSGTVELFRVSPLSAGEALFGKYFSYFLFGGLIAVILTALLVYVLRVPMLGQWWNYVLIIAALLFASLGIGFFISLISQTDSQAVQYTMLVLLISVFFSGFIASLDSLWAPVRVISWLSPTTYGALMLRDLMLRGLPPSPLVLGGLIALGVFFGLVSWLKLRGLISHAQ